MSYTMLIHYLEFNFKFVRRLLKKRVFFCNFVAKIGASSRVERGTRNEERGECEHAFEIEN